MKRILPAAAAALVLAGAMASPLQADTRWRLGGFFDDQVAPPPDAYFFDDGYGGEDPGLANEGYTETQPSLYDYDPNYYEPRYQPSQKRIDRVREALRAQEQSRKQVVKKMPVAPVGKVSPPATDAVASLQHKVPLETAKPQTAPAAKLVLPASPGTGVTCDKGATIVKGYGFSDVKPKTCTGDVFAFNAMRGGKAYEVLLSAKNGTLTEVKRQ